MPIEPPPSPWVFPTDAEVDESGLVAIGADLEPGTLLEAYRRGFFPMPIESGGPFGWWSPDPRGVLEPRAMHVSRSLRRSMRRFDIRVDTAFDAVVAGVAAGIIVVGAAATNALRIAGKSFADIRIVSTGGGAANINSHCGR